MSTVLSAPPNPMHRSNGYVLHETKTRVIIATGFARRTANRKTGNMLQVWILARHTSPVDAIKTGADSIVCGGCPLRGILGDRRACYVNLSHAPLAIWKAYQRGAYPRLARSELRSAFAGRRIRFGAYGDPAFIPLSLITAMARASAGWTGYTHRWGLPSVSAFREFLMARVDTAADWRAATRGGWRSFGLLPSPGGDSIECPSARGVSCADCLLCSGTRSDQETRASIHIEPHGPGAKHLLVWNMPTRTAIRIAPANALQPTYAALYAS